MNQTATHRSHLAGLIITLFAALFSAAQAPVQTGSLEVSARVRIEGKQQKLEHKRFFLIPGGLAENKGLLERIQGVEIASRDCYYSRVQASPQFICWLRSGDCDSPYCRKIEMPDIEQVPEFKAAYQKSLALFGQKPDIAQLWLTNNLAPPLTSGYYHEQQSLLEKLLAGIKPIQSSVTDSVGVKSVFLDIPVNISDAKTSETYTVSNVLPIEFSGKSYVWSCEVEISPEKPALVRLQVPENKKPVKNCEVVVKDLAVCRAVDCGQK